MLLNPALPNVGNPHDHGPNKGAEVDTGQGMSAHLSAKSMPPRHGTPDGPEKRESQDNVPIRPVEGRKLATDDGNKLEADEKRSGQNGYEMDLERQSHKVKVAFAKLVPGHTE